MKKPCHKQNPVAVSDGLPEMLRTSHASDPFDLKAVLKKWEKGNPFMDRDEGLARLLSEIANEFAR